MGIRELLLCGCLGLSGCVIDSAARQNYATLKLYSDKPVPAILVELPDFSEISLDKVWLRSPSYEERDELERRIYRQKF